ncbi:MAG: dihydroorotate dehydrogenase-like protein [Salinivirgaceae bacterium]|nr:dihydroorotate dehydrogenase-like protein [Salinivirgaceae bacterium]MDY0280293.1 dihydroorotate dehydrogenase-like protein [Salinivirgaceae bacterium]
MSNLETTFAGIKLKNPIIVGSSGLTNSVEKIKDLSNKGAAAVILKSLFEEQITHEINSAIQHNGDYPGAADYIKEYTKNHSVRNYLNLIKDAKESVEIPVIASINCQNIDEWISFAKEIETAGADALEVNAFYLALDKNRTSKQYEDPYFDLLKNLKANTKIPIIFKLGSNFTNLTGLANRLNADGIDGITLFNRFYEPDIDIEKLTLTTSEIFSHPSETRRIIRWLAILSDKARGLDISASTGVYDAQAAIKYLLAGATTVQLCSSIYKNGTGVIPEIINGIDQWMERKQYMHISDFRGLMSYRQIPDPTGYERAQFIRYFSNLE